MQEPLVTVCQNCQNPTPSDILQSSLAELGHSLCRSCHANMKMRIEQSTWEAIQLYFWLKKKGISATFENKPMRGITLSEPQVNIFIDSKQADDAGQVEETNGQYHAFRKGFMTVRIPNQYVTAELAETADGIVTFLRKNQEERGL